MSETRGEVGAIFYEGEQIGGFFDWTVTPKLLRAGASGKGAAKFICKVCNASIKSWYLFRYEQWCDFKFYWCRGSKLLLAGQWKGYLPELMKEGADGQRRGRPIGSIELEVA